MPIRPSDRPHPPALDALLGRRVPRRTLLTGAAGAGVLGAGAIAAGFGVLSGDEVKPPLSAATEPVAALSGGQAPSAPMVAAPSSPSAATNRRAAFQGAVPEGMALVSSPRLPLFGVGAADLDALLTGGASDWRAVGSPVSLPVELLALDGAAAGGDPVETFADYEALAAALDARPGGLALVPLDRVDFRVNVLAVDGFDPLRDAGTDGIVRIAVVGDIVPGRNVHLKMQGYGDWTRPFHKVADHLAAYDLTIANLEGNLSDSLPQPVEINPNTFDFVSSPAMLDGFKLAGIDAVGLANNHSAFNEQGWGAQGLLDTIASLEAAGVPFFGAGRDLDEARQPFVIEVGGRTVALLGVDGVTANRDIAAGIDTGVVGTDVGAGSGAGTNPYAFDQVTSDVAAAAEQYDIVIPYLHMGAEYKWLVPDWVVEAAHGCVDAGATVVVTNHPHLIQGMETYQTTPVVYSPGNFIFDQMFSIDTRQGLILEIVLDVRGDGVKVVAVRNRGVEIEDFHQPRLMTAEEHASIMDRFWRSTDWLATRRG